MKFVSAFLIAFFLHIRDHLAPSMQIENPFASNDLLFLFSSNSVVLAELFFIMSGILFTYHYGVKIRAQSGTLTLKTFMLKRWLRLFPLVAITTLAMFLVELILHCAGFGLWGATGTVDLVALATDLLFLGKPLFSQPNTYNGPIWYVTVLMLCYFIGYITEKKAGKNAVFVYLLLVIFGLGLYFSNWSFGPFNHSVARGLLAFNIGTLLGLFFLRYETFAAKTRLAIWVPAAALFILSMVFLFVKGKQLGPYVSDLTLFCDFILFPVMIITLYSVGPLNRLCKTRPIKFLGQISFGIYLWNFPLMALFFLVIRGTETKPETVSQWFWVIWACLVLAHILFATVTFLFVEKPLARIQRQRHDERLASNH